MRKQITTACAAIALAAGVVPQAHAFGRGFTDKLDNTTYSRLASAGSRSGNVCATYHGTVRFIGRGGDAFSRHACFDTARECRAWFREVQNRFPQSTIRRPCR